MSDPTTTIAVQSRLQVTAQFPTDRADNAKLPDLSSAGRRQVQRAVARFQRDKLPHAVRDDWNEFELEMPESGNLSPNLASQAIETRVADARLHATLPDLGVNPNTQTVLYNVHDNVQCTSVKIGLITKTTSEAIALTIPVQDPALPGGSGELEAVFEAELKWEVELGHAAH